MTVNRVILLNLADFKCSSICPDQVDRGGRHLGQETIRQALKNRGFTAVESFQRHPRFVPDLVANKAMVYSYLQDLHLKEPNTVVGISVWTNDYFKLSPFTALIRSLAPKVKIIADGPHFKRETIPGLLDPVERVLMEKLVDAVVVGHAQPFIDFILAGGNLQNAAFPGFYILDHTAQVISGRGIGAYPSLLSPPYVFNAQSRSLATLWNAQCLNSCGFCSIQPTGFPLFSPAAVIETLAAARRRLQPSQMGLHDPNPFSGKNALQYHEEIFAGLAARTRPIATSVINLEPSLLIDPSVRQTLLQLADRYFFWQFFVGRDTVTEASAKLTGRNLCHQPKNQAQLDAERQSLKDFIKAVKHFSEWTESKVPRHFMISYIISPLDDKPALLAMVDEMADFQALADHSTKITIRFSPLIPYPGTAVRKQLIGLLRDPADYNDLNIACNPWRDDLGPAVRLINLYQNAPLSSELPFQELRRLIAKA